MDDEVFVLSTMTIEVHDLPGRTVIGFNGTTEWALDDVDKDATVWLPREDQLRELLGPAFHRLERAGDRYRVVVTIWDEVGRVHRRRARRGVRGRPAAPARRRPTPTPRDRLGSSGRGPDRLGGPVDPSVEQEPVERNAPHRRWW